MSDTYMDSLETDIIDDYETVTIPTSTPASSPRSETSDLTYIKDQSSVESENVPSDLESKNLEGIIDQDLDKELEQDKEQDKELEQDKEQDKEQDQKIEADQKIETTRDSADDCYRYCCIGNYFNLFEKKITYLETIFN